MYWLTTRFEASLDIYHSNETIPRTAAAISNNWSNDFDERCHITILTPLAAASGLVRPWPHLAHGSLGSPESATQTASRSVQPFCRAHPCDQHTETHRQTDRQTTLRVTSVAIGRIYAIHAMPHNNNNNWTLWCMNVLTQTFLSFGKRV